MLNNPIQPFLQQQKTLILDGGLASELENRGHDLNHALWSAKLLLDNPAAIEQVHYDYFVAGADCAITATYQATEMGIVKMGLGGEAARGLILSAVNLALSARDNIHREQPQRQKPLVAASVGPYGAYLANGAEYTGDYDLNVDGLYKFHQARWQLLANSGADLLACETTPSYHEAQAFVRLAKETPQMPLWVSFQCCDGKHIADGTPIGACADLLNGLENVVAIGVNCTHPRFVPDLIRTLKRRTDKPIVVYPNAGEAYDPVSKKWVENKDRTAFAACAVDWVSAGATLVGGCCRSTPEDIRRVGEAIK